MKFECGDLERALAVSELMPEAREHLKHCAACRREYRLWNEISSVAKELHQEWDSPELWSAIRQRLEAEPKLKSASVWWREWKTWAAAAAVLIATGVLLVFQPWNQGGTPASNQAASSQAASNQAASNQAQMAALPKNRDFLTDQALREVEKAESTYRQSIDRLSRLAAPELQKPVSSVAVNCREKLLMLDSAIAETRANLDHNQLNVRLRTELAELYREKQHTLRELLTRDQKN